MYDSAAAFAAASTAAVAAAAAPVLQKLANAKVWPLTLSVTAHSMAGTDTYNESHACAREKTKKKRQRDAEHEHM